MTTHDLNENLARSTGFATADRLGKRCIAHLSREEIAQMSEAELAQAIRASRLPLDGHVEDDLEYYGRDTLERLMFLAREMCRHQCPNKPR